MPSDTKNPWASPDWSGVSLETLPDLEREQLERLAAQRALALVQLASFFDAAERETRAQFAGLRGHLLELEAGRALQ